ncbi:LysR family transcriptional regulator [Brevundimonas sp. LM2]|uniref:LysR family transcriptional regulator n=1 Tax=Brevundimonas sp. LM2 TaxID=1938605 RepID=UPI0009838C1C|nr:LysR family transcriptional regulator [Brevundimonas sp. LM2]AQR63597.1 LysR family transcriptional regulator [Brevundimonas sp. LM2]
MPRSSLPLNALRAFEAAARHGSFTKAAIELCVTQTAISHHVRSLEARLGAAMFKRVPRGVTLTAEGEALLPPLRESFDRIDALLDRFDGGALHEVLTLGVVGTFAVGWLLPRLQEFRERCPHIDLRLSTNNNHVDLAAEGLDYAIRFGDGAWHGTLAEALFDTPLAALCSPRVAAALRAPEDILQQPLLRSYRSDEWDAWFNAAGLGHRPSPIRGMTFDSSLAMMDAALQDAGVALAPPLMFERHLSTGAIVQPFDIQVPRGGYWLTRLQSKPETAAMAEFRSWLTSSRP